MKLVFDPSSITAAEAITIPIVLLICFAIGYISIRYSRSFKRKVRDGVLQEAIGTVVDHHDRGDTSSAIIEFTAQNGKKYRHVNSVSSNPAPKIGSNKTVYYDPKDPTVSYSGGEKFFLIFGLFFVGIGAIVLIRFLMVHIIVEGLMAV